MVAPSALRENRLRLSREARTTGGDRTRERTSKGGVNPATRAPEAIPGLFFIDGASARGRTWDRSRIRRMLYQLSYTCKLGLFDTTRNLLAFPLEDKIRLVY